jgi:hypothetical protein
LKLIRLGYVTPVPRFIGEENNKNEIKVADGETSHKNTALRDPVPLINKLPNIGPQYEDSSLS